MTSAIECGLGGICSNRRSLILSMNDFVEDNVILKGLGCRTLVTSKNRL